MRVGSHLRREQRQARWLWAGLVALLLTTGAHATPVQAQEIAPEQAAAQETVPAPEAIPAQDIAHDQDSLSAAAADPAAASEVGIPLLQSPADGSMHTGESDPPVGVPVLSWQPVGGADRYNIQVSSSLGFANPVVNRDVPYTSYITSLALPDGVYYWRVRARANRVWGNFSEVRSFSKEWGTGGTLRPMLVSPAHDPDGLAAVASFTADHFQWEPVPGAASYRFEISTTPSFNNTSDRNNYYSTETLVPRHTPVWHLANGVYYWRVTPLDNQGNAGAASDVYAFTYRWDQVPVLVAPDSNPLDQAPVQLRFLPRFQWEAVAGASSYLLEVSTQEDFSSIDLSITTPNTEYTPVKNLDNNKDYYWRVKAIRQLRNGTTTSPSSEVRRFNASWSIAPIQLTPQNASIERIYPYFSWTPVAGAERYRIQIDKSDGFERPIADKTLYNATAYTQPEWRDGVTFGQDVFWRVQAIDARGNTTPWSDIRFFRFVAKPPPNLVYPGYYYAQDDEGMPVNTDRTIAYPVFVWDSTHQYFGGNGPASFAYPAYYSVTVSTDLFFKQVNFAVESAGLAAAPTKANPITGLQDGQTYYWRVYPMDSSGGTMSDSAVIWQFRYDSRVPQLPVTNDGALTPIHPADGFEAVSVAPVLGWLPVEGADHYTVEVARDPNFNVIVDTAEALFPYYVPWQGSQEPIPFGMYWWRVRAKDAANNPLTQWSPARRFALSVDLVTGNPHDYRVPTGGTLLSEGDRYDPKWSRVAAGSDTPAAPYGLGALHIVQDRSLTPINYNWIFAFGVPPGVAGQVQYGIYIDVNRDPNLGATSDPLGKPITTDPLYRPEYVLYIDRTDDAISDAWFYEWNGSSWVGPFHVNGLGGGITYDPASAAIQVILPYTTIVKETDKFIGSLAITLFSSAPGAGGGMQESVPAQTGSHINEPVLLSDMLMPLYPFDTPDTNPIVFHELPSLRWRMPYFDSVDGYQVQVARDIDFTNIVETWESFETDTSSFYGAIPSAFHSGKDYTDEESYYWRVRIRHERWDRRGDYDVGAWSPPMRFKLTSYVPGNPTVSLGDTAEATPSFSWDRVEGAAGYTIQIDNDANMSSPIKTEKIDGNSYVLRETLADGTYYWRVAMRRSNNVTGQWTPIMSFVKQSLRPTPISPVDGVVINQQPTFVWTEVITNSGSLRTSAPRYRLQWDSDPNFSRPASVDTVLTTYTLGKGQSLSDGTWYWRVAVIDGNNKIGAYSPTQTFYKEYLPPALITPLPGSRIGSEVTFTWAPLAGAASYKLEYADNEAFNRAKSVTTDQTRYIPIDMLKPGDYYWRVKMIDKDRREGPYTLGRFSNTHQLFLPSLRTP